MEGSAPFGPDNAALLLGIALLFLGFAFLIASFLRPARSKRDSNVEDLGHFLTIVEFFFWIPLEIVTFVFRNR